MELLSKKRQSSRKKSTTIRFWMPNKTKTTRRRITPFRPSWEMMWSHSTTRKLIQIISKSRIWQKSILEECAIGVEDSALQRSASPAIWTNFNNPQRELKIIHSGIEKELLVRPKYKSHQTKWTTCQEKISPLIPHQNKVRPILHYKPLITVMALSMSIRKPTETTFSQT